MRTMRWLCLGAASGLLALPTAASAQDTSSIGVGARVYAATCGRCHNARAATERSDLEWEVILLHMRTRGNLSGRETKEVLAFLQATNGSELAGEPLVETAETAGQEDTSTLRQEGVALILQKGCMACHRVGEYQTGTLGPDLNTVFQRRTEEYIQEKLMNPRSTNPTSVMPQMNLTARQRAAIITYLRSVAR